MVRKSKEDAEKTRQAILESALDVFSEKGFAKATFDEIAYRAGYTKGAVYWYFRNKADLVSALILEYVQRIRTEISSYDLKNNTLEELLEYFVVWSSVCRNNEQFIKFYKFALCQMEWSEAVIRRVDKNLATEKAFHLEKINKVLIECSKNGTLKDGVDISKAQYAILASYRGIIIGFLCKHFDYDVVDMIKTGLGLIIDGIRK